MPRDRDGSDPRGGSTASGSGRTIGGRYRLEEVLGRGGMGVVWAGHDELLHRPVAVKEVVPPSGVDDAEREELRARTMREARAAARVSTAGVVAIYDVVEDDGRPWIVMERLPPRTLDDELSERGGLPAAEVAQIGTTLLAGLMAAHSAGVLHRDVKPSNVMFRERPDGRQAVLADFGIAHSDGDAAITAAGLMLGSPAYIAPERARGEPATPASDLWSLGVTLWAAVEGWSPFGRANSLASLNAVVTEDVPRPVRAGALEPVLDGLLRKDPAERIDAATAQRMLADALPPEGPPTERLGVATTGPAPVPVDLPPSFPPAEPAWWTPASLGEGAPAVERPAPRRRRSRLPAVVAVVLVALVAVATAVLDPFGDGRDPADAGLDAATTPTAPDAEDQAPAAGETEEDAAAAEEDAAAPEDAGTGADAGAGEPAPAPEEGAQDTGAAAVPAGFELYTDPTGFSVAVPAGWEAEREGPRVYISDPASRAYLLVDQTDDPEPDAVADWQQQEPAVADRLENYARIGEIEAVDYRGWQAADWEFVFGPDHSTHVLNRNVITGPDRAYALYWSVPSSQWEAMLPVHEQIAATFQPAP